MVSNNACLAQQCLSLWLWFLGVTVIKEELITQLSFDLMRFQILA